MLECWNDWFLEHDRSAVMTQANAAWKALSDGKKARWETKAQTKNDARPQAAALAQAQVDLALVLAQAQAALNAAAAAADLDEALSTPIGPGSAESPLGKANTVGPWPRTKVCRKPGTAPGPRSSPLSQKGRRRTSFAQRKTKTCPARTTRKAAIQKG